MASDELKQILETLRSRGLHVVTDADMQLLALIKDPPRLIEQLSGELEEKGLRIATRAEVRVLEAVAQAPLDVLDCGSTSARSQWLMHVVQAELARREAKR